MYKLTNSTSITRLSDGASIPTDPANTDYAAYLKWLSEGNTPTPADIPPAPTPAQKQSALEDLIQKRLDAKAQSMNFDNLLSGIANASLPVGEYRQADGAALLLWRARTWQKAAEIRDAYLAGGPEPTWAEVEAQLPGYPIV